MRCDTDTDEESETHNKSNVSITRNLQKCGFRGLKEYNKIAKHMHDTIVTHYTPSGEGLKGYHIISIRKVENKLLWSKYKKREAEIRAEIGYANEKLLYHGSSNVYQIAKTGFDINYAQNSGMFGSGIYFAEHSSKSNQYVFGYLGKDGCPKHGSANCTECDKYMLLCRVLAGKECQLSATSKMIQPPAKYHSIRGVPSPRGLRYPEYVIYREDQAYPQYLITYRVLK